VGKFLLTPSVTSTVEGELKGLRRN